MKNIKIILTITFVFTFSCSSQNKKEKIISKFIEEVILNESYDISKIDEFINISRDSLLSNSNTYKHLKINVDLIRYEIIKNNNEFEIVTYSEFKDKQEGFNIVYPNTNEIFCIISNDKKLITPIIIGKNNKIISFYTGLIKFKSKINPFIYEKN